MRRHGPRSVRRSTLELGEQRLDFAPLGFFY